jgi:hypothetical protein
VKYFLKGSNQGKKFQKQVNKKQKGTFELVHSNIYGPFIAKSIGGADHFIIFIDDKNRMMWIKSFKSKDQVLKVF